LKLFKKSIIIRIVIHGTPFPFSRLFPEDGYLFYYFVGRGETIAKPDFHLFFTIIYANTAMIPLGSIYDMGNPAVWANESLDFCTGNKDFPVEFYGLKLSSLQKFINRVQAKSQRHSSFLRAVCHFIVNSHLATSYDVDK
jgi:hypothetical protein